MAASALAQTSAPDPARRPSRTNPSQNQPDPPIHPVDPPNSPPAETRRAQGRAAQQPGQNQPLGPTAGRSQPTQPADHTRPHRPRPHSPSCSRIPAHPSRRPPTASSPTAATPAQLCPIADGLQYYFIGADGSSQQGPWIPPFSELAGLASASVYSGSNPKTGKSVTITYLAAENMIRVSTFYPDNQYDTNKPYNFTVDSDHAVTHEAW